MLFHKGVQVTTVHNHRVDVVDRRREAPRQKGTTFRLLTLSSPFHIELAGLYANYTWSDITVLRVGGI